MGNVFSFYQYEGTGRNGEILPISNPNYTQWTGFYVPPSVIEGRRVGFLWRLFDDYEERSPKYRVRISGEAGNRFNESHYLSLAMSGNLSTVVTDSGICVVGFTGEVATGNKDIAFFSTLYTGTLVTGRNDQADFSTVISGSYSIVHKDIASFTSAFYGLIPIMGNDSPTLGLAWSGGFTKKDKDYMTFVYELSGVSYRIGGKKMLSTGEDTANIGFEMSQVIYEWR